jgi:hypothetical protein
MGFRVGQQMGTTYTDSSQYLGDCPSTPFGDSVSSLISSTEIEGMSQVLKAMEEEKEDLGLVVGCDALVLLQAVKLELYRCMMPPSKQVAADDTSSVMAEEKQRRSKGEEQKQDSRAVFM